MTIKILATGFDFIQSGVIGTAPTIEEMMKNPETLHILAYVISKYAKNFLKLLGDAIETKVETTLVINDLQNQKDKEVIEKLEYWDKNYDNFRLVDFDRRYNPKIKSDFSGTCSICGKTWNVDDIIFLQLEPRLVCKDEQCFKSNGGDMSPKKMLHAKVIVVNGEKAVVGSANFSWGGMSGHYEVGIYLEGDEARTLAEIVTAVADSSKN